MLLGKGQYGNVFKCKRKGFSGKEYAMKVINKPPNEKVKGWKEKVDNEYDCHNEVDTCPHIPTLYAKWYSSNLFRKKHKATIVMEWVDGRPLSEYTTSMSELSSREIFTQLCVAVKFCHEKQIYHNDIKLDNVMLKKHRGEPGTDTITSSGVFFVYLIDFGEATRTPPSEHSQRHLRDMYGLGKILFYLILGKKITEGFNFEDRPINVSFKLDKLISGKSLKGLVKQLIGVADGNELSIDDVLSHEWVTGDARHSLQLKETQKIPVPLPRY